MEEAGPTRYWCYMCSQRVNPVMESDAIKCPICQSGFVEEMSPSGNDSPLDNTSNHNNSEVGGSDSDRALSMWAPILLGMMGNPRRRRRMRRMEFEEDDGENDSIHHLLRSEETELDRELDSIIRRRRRSSATILQLLQGIRAGIIAESTNSDNEQRTLLDRDSDGDRERVILINPFNQTIIVQGPNNDSQNRVPPPIGASLGDYFIGPGLDLLLQHLSENDPSRYGTPPTKKEAVEALPTVNLEEKVQCSVCLDDCEVGSQVREMPCKHKFHSGCILPWLELHSSCPVCRHQLPCDDSKLDSSNTSFNSNPEISDGNSNVEGERNESGRQFSVALPWPFSSLFSSPNTSRSRSNGGNSSITSVSDVNPRDDENPE